jgi:hypothetical protein
MSDFGNAGKLTIRVANGVVMVKAGQQIKYALTLRHVFFMGLLLFAAAAQAQPNTGLFRCKNQKNLINLSINDSGRSVEGPACAQIVINSLRYDADFGKTVTTSAGPNLASVFPSSFSAGGAQPAKAESLNEHFNADFANAQALQGQLFALEAQIRKTSADTDRYLAKLKGLINQTDGVLRTNGPQAVVDLVKDPANQKEMDDAIKAAFNWQTTDGIIAGLQRVQADLNSLPIRFPANTGTVSSDPCSNANIDQLGWTDWDKCRDAQYRAAQSIVAAALTEAAPFTSDGDKAAQFARKIGIIQFWKNLITTLNVDSFILQAEVSCGVLFNKNEQTVLKLLLTDRLSIFDGPLAGAQTKDGLLTVTCSSPFALSAGAAFSTIGNRQFAIVKSAPASGTTSVNEFGITSDSKITPYPIAMAHARLTNWADNRYALHFSFGVGAKLAGDSSGGSSPEFLVGPSFSFLRTIFLTAGLDIGKKSKLAGGFSVGGTVPTDITTPPISSSYTEGFGFAITFTKP